MPLTHRFAPLAIPVAILALATGCRHAGPIDPIDAGNDAGESPGTDLPEWADPECSATMGRACRALADELFQVELDAAVLAGDGTWRFVDIGGFHGVLAARDLGDGPEPVVVFPDQWIDGGIVLNQIAVLPEAADEGIEPIGITEALSSWDDGEAQWLYAVLTSSPSGYAVYGVPRAELSDNDTDTIEDPTGFPKVTMQQKFDGDDLDGFALRGIAHGDTTNYGETLCAYGDGIRCGGSGVWEQWVATASGSFNDLIFEPVGPAEGLAVGDGGSMVRCMDFGWQNIESSTDADLRVVLGTAAGYYAGGEDGTYSTLYNTAPPPDAASTTQLASAAIADLFWPLPFDPEAAGGIELSGLTADGCAFDLKGTEIISCFGAHALDGEVIGSTYWTVPMVASGRFFLTEDRLYRFTIQGD